MQKSKGTTNRIFIQKMLFITLVIAFVIFIVAMARNFWLLINFEHNKTKTQMDSMQQKIDALSQHVQIASASSPVDMHAYTLAQIKNAYLLVRTANISLQQDQDLAVSKQLMQMAIENLADLQGAKIEQAKKVLAADLEKINAVHLTDKGNIQDKLNMLDKLINVLPAYKNQTVEVVPNATAKANKPDTKQSWYQPICNMFANMRSVITIRKKSDREVTVTDVDVGRAQFKLIIEQLRWAAFYNNADVYQRSIKNAQDLLPELFDMHSESVQKFAAILNELKQIQLSTSVPNLQNSINVLQTILVG